MELFVYMLQSFILLQITYQGITSLSLFLCRFAMAFDFASVAMQRRMESKFGGKRVRVRNLQKAKGTFELHFYDQPTNGRKIKTQEPLLPHEEIDVEEVVATRSRICGGTQRGWINLAVDRNAQGERRLVYYVDVVAVAEDAMHNVEA